MYCWTRELLPPVWAYAKKSAGYKEDANVHTFIESGRNYSSHSFICGSSLSVTGWRDGSISSSSDKCCCGRRGEASPQQGDLRFSGPPSAQDTDGGARTRDKRIPADFRADSLTTVPPTPRKS
ncbi:hypothetical protein PoB_002054400 [Plakobranchus ocellatus]|uniref:Uncharacterized protein n=1 Tax=Plakobranchus ocellatus TaxID=259542 RepID=A0AAV3ZI10_9GAST|nr:hypothetical protein PoB_002054400 [Plakobranchus ocellatus]